ncbi:MAG TPA: SDR family NAD(P)-dependent oxidoreductase [Asticcacaulis sp.]|nr:SDR family NAD(P)-dependent oxidoreductase [Asticcacaulis sp.]
MSHSAFQSGNVAVVTGGASGIGLAAAQKLAAMGLLLIIVDLGTDRLQAAAETIARSVPGAVIITHETDVSDRSAWVDLLALVQVHGGADVLMNNAAISPGSSALDPAGWAATLDVNLMGVIYGTQTLAPAMLSSGKSGLIINTGSKQGITTPPGNPAYNVAKAGVKVFTEAVQHELRNTPGCEVTAHLFVPGFVWTGMTARGRTEKPDSAWTPEQTIDFMIEGVNRGDFYILCPDGETTRALDEKRMAWAMGDIIENRPPLSRWHPDYADAWRAWLDN